MAAARFCAAAPQPATASSAFQSTVAESPVQWMPWGDAALARAKTENRPVFVAVGLFTSELSRAMVRQSFSNQETAMLLNENFVCVLVDAKERADVAALYQNYLQAVKQLSGPPMNVWLTPEFKPFEGANYLPPTEEWGKEGFVTATKRVTAAWKTDAAGQARKADEAIATVEAAQPTTPAPAIDQAEIKRLLDESAALWRARFDAQNGGFGESPKYPEPELLRFLLAKEETRDMAVTTLDRMVNGALRDPLDGGFFRYAVDLEWKQPYFQKLLVDQPRLALALLDAARITGKPVYAQLAAEALHYVIDRLAIAGGDFANAEDTTSESLTTGYLWTLDELRQVLGEKAGDEFARIHGATAEGNVGEDAFPGVATKGKNLLRRAEPLTTAGVDQTTTQAAEKLREVRQRRAPALRDDGTPSGAHGLLLTALSRAAEEVKDDRLAAAAKAEVAFIRAHLRNEDGSLRRLARNAAAAGPADYALVIEGLTTHATLASDPASSALARELLQTATSQLWDSAAGRCYVAPAGAPGFWTRLYSPAPGAGDPPTAEPALLLAVSARPAEDAATKDLVEKLTRTIAGDIKNSVDAPRGDLLLALQSTQR